MSKKKKDLTEGSILKSLLILAIPIILANLLQTAYQLIDTFWVGRLGADAVAAVSISFPFIFLIVSFGGGLAIAGTILVAQYYGKKDKKAVDHIASQTLMMIVIVSIILAVIGYLLSPFLVSLMGVEESVYSDAVFYLRVSFIGIVFVFTYSCVSIIDEGYRRGENACLYCSWNRSFGFNF